MADKEDIELIHITKYYLSLAKQSGRRVTLKRISSKTLRSQTTKHLLKSSPPPERRVFAHLASAAFRICTMYEKHKFKFMKIYYRQFYDRKDKRAPQWPTKRKVISEIKKNLSAYLPHLLRDCVAHYENREKFAYADRLYVIGQLRIDECLVAMERVIKDIELAVDN